MEITGAGREKGRLRFRRTTDEVRFDGAVAFKRMHDAFERALSAYPNKLWKSVWTFAGQAAYVRVIGYNLAKYISQPFEHLMETNGHIGTPVLRIDLWDGMETEMPCPVDMVDAVRRSRGDHGFVIGSSHDRFVGCQGPQIVTWFDRATERVIGWVGNSSQLSVYERGKPLFFPLLLWHNDRDVPVVHAGLVSYRGEGVLFAGEQGVGKSTSALACVGAGFDYLGDDYIGLKTVDDGSIVGCSVYNSTWLEPEHLLRFPRLGPYVIREGVEKFPVLLSEVYPEQLARVAPIRAVVLPRVGHLAVARISAASKRDGVAGFADGNPSGIRVAPDALLFVVPKQFRMH